MIGKVRITCTIPVNCEYTFVCVRVVCVYLCVVDK